MRDQMHLSQPILNSDKDLQAAIDAVKSGEIISGFNDFKNKRKKVIKEVIEWNDGLNHVRVGNEIIEFISKKSKISSIDSMLALPSTKNVISQRLKWIIFQYFPFLSKPTKNEKSRLKWNKNELKAFSSKRMKQQSYFYDLFKLDREKLLKIRAQ